MGPCPAIFHIVEKTSLGRPNPGNRAINAHGWFGETTKRLYSDPGPDRMHTRFSLLPITLNMLRDINTRLIQPD
jgi:hypothetical protein